MKTTEIKFGFDDIPNITIGHAKTFNTRRILFDFSALKQRYGDGEFTLLFIRPGESDTRPENEIKVPVAIFGSKAAWTITDDDTAKAGTGTAECIFRGNKFCYKSNVFHVIVGHDIND